MHYTKHIIIYILIIATTSGCASKILSKNAFIDVLSKNDTSREQNDFDPERDIEFLPPLADKEFFESVNDLSICRRPDVRKYIYLYMTTGRKFLRSAIKRSKLYLDIIQESFKKNKDIPGDLAYLPLLESAFNPRAVSRSKAMGLWQFLRSTGRSLGLKRDRWIDERRNIEKSTLAAIKHLMNLHKNFKSWELAITAYNGGAGHVKRTMRKSKTSNAIDLINSGKLKQETSEFSARFAALLIIYKNQQLFDIEDIPNNLAKGKTVNITLKYPTDIRKVARYGGISLNTIRLYNPELKRYYTPPYYRNYILRIPLKSRARLAKNMSNLYRVRYKKLKRHIVKKGECLSKIAARYKTKVYKIRAINNIRNPHLIREGHKLYIPI